MAKRLNEASGFIGCSNRGSWAKDEMTRKETMVEVTMKSLRCIVDKNGTIRRIRECEIVMKLDKL